MANGEGLIHFPSLSRMALGLANLGERQRGNVLREHSLEQRERAACMLGGGQGKRGPHEQANAGWGKGLAGRPTKGHPKIDRVECWKLRVKNKFTYQQIAPVGRSLFSDLVEDLASWYSGSHLVSNAVC